MISVHSPALYQFTTWDGSTGKKSLGTSAYGLSTTGSVEAIFTAEVFDGLRTVIDLGGTNPTTLILWSGTTTTPTVGFSYGNGASSSLRAYSTGIAANKKSHVLIKWNGANLKFYVNGTSAVTETDADLSGVAAGTKWIGCQVGTIRFHQGRIYLINTFSTELSDSEAATRTSGGVGTTAPDTTWVPPQAD